MTALSNLVFTDDRAPRAFTRRRRMILRDPAENEGGIFVPKIISKPRPFCVHMSLSPCVKSPAQPPVHWSRRSKPLPSVIMNGML